MSKKQKIWLGVFLAMFIIPELLWSPILNTLYELWQSGNVIPFRENFIMASDNLLYFRLVNFMQLVGIVFASVVLFKTSNKKFISWFFNVGVNNVFAAFVIPTRRHRPIF